jgi:hypothetical protein
MDAVTIAVAVLVAVPMTVYLMRAVQAPLLKEISSARKPLMDAIHALEASNTKLIAKAVSRDVTAYHGMLQAEREAARPYEAEIEPNQLTPEQIEEQFAELENSFNGDMPVGM